MRPGRIDDTEYPGPATGIAESRQIVSIIRSHADRAETFFGGDNGPLHCFFCLKLLGYPFLHWSGFDGHIGLHRDCYFELFIRLAHDALEMSRK